MDAIKTRKAAKKAMDAAQGFFDHTMGLEQALLEVFGTTDISTIIAHCDDGYIPTIRADLVGWRWATVLARHWTQEFYRIKGKLSIPYVTC